MNIMVKDGSQGFKLVDFEWSGRIGEVQYLMNVYRGQRLWRPREAEDVQPIKADHDIEMLEAMERQISGDHKTTCQLMRRTLKMMMKIRPQVARKLKPLVDHYENNAPKYFERIRDMRWHLMTIGAEQVRDERGPVFDNAEDLTRYLASLRN